MIEFFFPNSRALLPNFRTNCPDGISFCPDGVSFCPEYHPQPLVFTQPSHLPFVLTQNTPNPTPKHLFSWSELESGQINYRLGNLDPNWAKLSKSAQNFSRSGAKWAKKNDSFLLFTSCFNNTFSSFFWRSVGNWLNTLLRLIKVANI